MIPLSKPFLGKEEIKAVSEVLRSGWLTRGKRAVELEQLFAEYIGTKYAVSLSSCAAALQLALQAYRLKGEVILPSFTFVASVNAVINAGCIPRFADIEYRSCNLDPEKLQKLINKNTVAVMPVHFAGQSCNMRRIGAIAEKFGLRVIEDSAEAIGAECNGKKTGSFGVGCFSFFPSKNITCGEGGMLTTNNKKLANFVRSYSNHGLATQRKGRNQAVWFREADLAGYNYRLTDIQAAIAIVQLRKLERMNALRKRYAGYLNARLPQDQLDLPLTSFGSSHVYQMYTVKIRSPRINRKKLVENLNRKGIEASVHFYPPLHKQKLYRKFLRNSDDLPITEKVAASILTLPLFPQMTEQMLDHIVASVKEALYLSSH